MTETTTRKMSKHGIDAPKKSKKNAMQTASAGKKKTANSLAVSSGGNAISGQAEKYIQIQNSRVHNLKSVSVSIPRNALTVVTGVSGSGKSSLAFDTLYAEGQRRFAESLSSYARQFLERMQKPDVDSISGLPPAIAIEQRGFAKSGRSIVATTTEVYDYLRLLYGRIGTTICTCGRVVKKDSPQQAVREILTQSNGHRIYILFPLSNEAGTLAEQLDKIRRLGYDRACKRNSNIIIDLDDLESAARTQPENILIVADRLVLSNDEELITRLSDSVEAAFRMGNGRIAVTDVTADVEYNFSVHYECPDCLDKYKEPEPRLFSFNSPVGACPTCQGFGRSMGYSEDLVIPDKSVSLTNRAIHPYRTSGFYEWQDKLIAMCAAKNISTTVPYSILSPEQKHIIWHGTEQYTGILGLFSMLENNSQKMHYRAMASRYRGYTKCLSCNGTRLRKSARSVYVSGKTIGFVVDLTLEEARLHFQNIQLSDMQWDIAGEIIKELCRRLDMLVDIGLGYVGLNRLSHTLSGGEAQRINLATALGSSLVGTLYVLDEPSIGLHSADTAKLLSLLKKLRNLGNTVVVVEHDLEIISAADFIIDMGPKAGEHGGEIMATGCVQDVMNSDVSPTGKYLSGAVEIALPEHRRRPTEWMKIINPREHNLRCGEVHIPLNVLCVATGVSGSGKSTLIREVLYTNLKKKLGVLGNGSVGACEGLEGYEDVCYVEMVDQTPIGRSSRSTPITYTKVFDAVRDVFADTQAAKQMGWRPGHFSFNVSGGRCDVCEGEGSVTVEMQFLPDIQLECEACKGSRYKKEVHNVMFRDKNIVQVLAMTVDEASEHFQGVKKVENRLQTLQNVGLGYLRMGQSSSMLSGGEAQRIKLATYIDNDYSHHTLFIFDEPTTGLHLQDIATLLRCFNNLIDKGHSVIIIEHNLHVVASADWIIDIGPGAGDQGGEIVAKGTPEDVANNSASLTGKALAAMFPERFPAADKKSALRKSKKK